MTIIVKNKGTLQYDDFYFKCIVGKNGLSKKKIEGDKKTPIGLFSLGDLYYRKDRNSKPLTKLRCIPIERKMGWCNDKLNKKFYNKLIKINNNIKGERLYRRDFKYDYMIPINYNTKKIKLGIGSAIFLHLTKDFKPTLGCVALKKKRFFNIIKIN